jgi:CheY-like chemotaxis protein
VESVRKLWESCTSSLPTLIAIVIRQTMANISNPGSAPPKLGHVIRRAMAVFSKGAALADRRLLIVEDDPATADDLAHALQSAGAWVQVANSPSRAIALMAQTQFSAAVVDYKIGDRHSPELCWTLRGHNVPFVFYGSIDFLKRVWPDVESIPKTSSASVVLKAVARLRAPTP